MDKVEGITLNDELKQVQEDRLKFKREQVQAKIHAILNDIEQQLNTIKKYEKKIETAKEYQKKNEELLERVKKEEWEALSEKKDQSIETGWTIVDPFRFITIN